MEAISESLDAQVQYLGAPTFAYTVGNYRIEKDGTMSGESDPALFAALEQKGFEPAAGESGSPVQAAGDEAQSETSPTANDSDLLSIEFPLDGFTSEAIENLTKMVSAKEVLLKKALGAEELPIQVLEDRICFCWFPAANEDGELAAYSQFITALCQAAKEKKRVTAKAQESYENERFAMRVWLIGLGMIGEEFKLARKLLMANLSGNSAWRHGKPQGKEDPAE